MDLELDFADVVDLGEALGERPGGSPTIQVEVSLISFSFKSTVLWVGQSTMRCRS